MPLGACNVFPFNDAACSAIGTYLKGNRVMKWYPVDHQWESIGTLVTSPHISGGGFGAGGYTGIPQYTAPVNPAQQTNEATDMAPLGTIGGDSYYAGFSYAGFSGDWNAGAYTTPATTVTAAAPTVTAAGGLSAAMGQETVGPAPITAPGAPEQVTVSAPMPQPVYVPPVYVAPPQAQPLNTQPFATPAMYTYYYDTTGATRTGGGGSGGGGSGGGGKASGGTPSAGQPPQQQTAAQQQQAAQIAAQQAAITRLQQQAAAQQAAAAAAARARAVTPTNANIPPAGSTRGILTDIFGGAGYSTGTAVAPAPGVATPTGATPSLASTTNTRNMLIMGGLLVLLVLGSQTER